VLAISPCPMQRVGFQDLSDDLGTETCGGHVPRSTVLKAARLAMRTAKARASSYR
jgi:hypothetical protein